MQGNVPTYQFLGLRVQPLTKSDLLGVIESVADSNTYNCVIGNHNMHSLYLSHNDEEMQRFYRGNRYTYIDGMPLIFLAWLFGIPLRRRHRAAAHDWLANFLRTAEQRNWRIYFLGGKPEVASEVVDRFSTEYPCLQIRSHHGSTG